MKNRGIVLLILILAVALFAQTPKRKTFTIKVRESAFYAPMGFMLTPESPEAVKSGGAVVQAGTDFYGLPRDPLHPSMGAIQWHEPTPDYLSLVRKICSYRYDVLTPDQRIRIKAEIEDLFEKVYGYRR